MKAPGFRRFVLANGVRLLCNMRAVSEVTYSERVVAGLDNNERCRGILATLETNSPVEPGPAQPSAYARADGASAALMRGPDTGGGLTRKGELRR